MKKYTLFSLVSILLVTFFSFNVNSAKANNCAPGDLFNNVTGQACGAISATVACSTGDVFSTLTGQRCTAWQDNSSSSDLTKFKSLFQSWFKVGVNSTNIKPLQQFLKDQGYYFGKIDGKYGKITDRAVKDFQDDNSFTKPVASAIQTLSITTTSLPEGTVGTSYMTTIKSSGGSEPYKWSASGLPAGLILEINGVACVNNYETCPSITNGAFIAGTPTTAGTYLVTVILSSGTQTVSKQFSLIISVSSGALTITTTSLPSGTIGASYSASILGSGGGSNSYQWSVTGVPAGLQTIGTNIICAVSLSCPNQVPILISGTPTIVGTYPVTVTLTSGTQTVSKQFSLTIDPATTTQTLTIITPSVLPNAIVEIPYSTSIAASGAPTPFNWSILSGNLPPGITNQIQAGGNFGISGTPITAGTYTFTIQNISGSQTTSKQFTLTVDPASTVQVLSSIDTPSSLPNAKAGSAYTTTLSVSPSSASTNQLYWSVISGILPEGLALSNGGSGEIITGTPCDDCPGTYTFTLQVATSLTSSGAISKQFTLIVESKTTNQVLSTMPITNTSLAKGTVGISYAEYLQTGAAGLYTWSVTGLPTGLSLTGNKISGTPTVAGAYTVNVTLTSTSSTSVTPGSKQLILTIDPATANALTCTSDSNCSTGQICNSNKICVANTSMAVNGVCGTLNGTSIAGIPPALGATSQCSVGTASAFSGSGPWTWTCAVLNGGATASCSASKTSATVVVNGVCGTPTATQLGAPTIAPTSLCSTGTPGPLSGTSATSKLWTWTCTGSNSGKSSSCLVSKATASPTYPTCGSSNHQTLPSSPTTNLCSVGKASAVTIIGPNSLGTKYWTWGCTSSGSSVACNATIGTPASVLGAQSFHFTQFLEQGSTGNEVVELQKLLNKAGYNAGIVDGIFGPKVKEALIKFQIANNLKADGIVGFEVRTFLNK